MKTPQFPDFKELVRYRDSLIEELHAFRITRREFHRRVNKAVDEFNQKLDAAGNLELVQWLDAHEGEWNEEVLAKREELLRRLIKQSKMSLEEFIGHLVVRGLVHLDTKGGMPSEQRTGHKRTRTCGRRNKPKR